MLPWVYEFHWTPFHITFLLVFFSVFVAVITTVVMAMRRTLEDERMNRFDAIVWHSNFDDLSPAMKVCRHQLIGDVQHRICDNGFDCGGCKVHAKLLLKKHPSPVHQFEVFGFTMPPYRLYHRGHTWVQQEHDGTYTIGIDDFGSRIIGKPFTVSLPPIGSRLSVNGQGLLVTKADASIRILSPIDGEVIDHGDAEKGWWLKIKATDPENGTAHLLRDGEIRPWMMREMERLQMSFASAGVGATLADGGELVPDFHKHFPGADWDGVLGQMFLEA